MDREPIIILVFSLILGIVYFFLGSPSWAPSSIERQINSLFHIWMSLSVSVWVFVVGLITRSIMKFRERK